MTTYRPLPPYLTVATSQIDGLGIFATQPIPKTTDIGLIRIHIELTGEIIRTPLGGFINGDDDDPNLHSYEKEILGPLKYVNAVTTRRIDAGEELVLRYTLYDPTTG